MFHLAFENSVEPGYVTEKPFDALMAGDLILGKLKLNFECLHAGTVPIYLGDSAHFKTLLPHPKAAIFISDYNDNITALVKYLNFLTTNETAYEEHRQWRADFSYERNVRDKPLLQKSWFCRVCEWAVNAAPQHHKRTRVCDKAGHIARQDLNGKAVRGNTKTVYLVENNTLRSIPDLDTFFALKLELEHIIPLTENEMKRLSEGPPIAIAGI